MRTLLVLLSGVAVWAAPACNQSPAEAQAPPPRAVVDVERLMVQTVEPAANAIWKSVSTTVSIEGVKERFPRNDKEWAAVRSSAHTLAKSGRLLLGNRGKDTDPWAAMSRDLIEAAEETIEAAEAKRPEGILDAGEKIYYACIGCHRRYPGRMQNQ